MDPEDAAGHWLFIAMDPEYAAGHWLFTVRGLTETVSFLVIKSPIPLKSLANCQSW